MNQMSQLSQSGNIVSDFTNHTPIKRGRGRPRKNTLVTQVSPHLSEGASTMNLQTGY